MYINIDQKPVNSLHRLLNCDISGLHCRVATTEYRLSSVHCIDRYHVIYLGLYGKCFHTIDRGGMAQWVARLTCNVERSMVRAPSKAPLSKKLYLIA